jgi:hypothetical protein
LLYSPLQLLLSLRPRLHVASLLTVPKAALMHLLGVPSAVARELRAVSYVSASSLGKTENYGQPCWMLDFDFSFGDIL